MSTNKIALLLILAACVITFSGLTVLHSTGVYFETGSPYDGQDCGVCHHGGSSLPTLSVTTVPALGAGNMYIPNTTYTISVVCSGAYPKFGFDTEILNTNSGSAAAIDRGIFGAALAHCKIITTANQPTNVTHTTPTGTANSATFSFLWTAPDTGTAYLYVACLGSNQNGAVTGDATQILSMVLQNAFAGISAYSENRINMQVWPNPATGKVNISYTLNEEGIVWIQLYTLNGELLSELLNEKQHPGNHAAEFHLPVFVRKGVYMIKVKINNRETFQKLLVN